MYVGRVAIYLVRYLQYMPSIADNLMQSLIHHPNTQVGISLNQGDGYPMPILDPRS